MFKIKFMNLKKMFFSFVLVATFLLPSLSFAENRSIEDNRTIYDQYKEWTIVFNNDLDENYELPIYIVDNEWDIHPTTTKVKGNTVIVTPLDAYVPNKQYTLTVDSGVMDVDGRILKESVYVNFRCLNNFVDDTYENEKYKQLVGDNIKISGSISLLKPFPEDENIVIRATYLSRSKHACSDPFPMEKGCKDFKLKIGKGINSVNYSLDLKNPIESDDVEKGYKLEFFNDNYTHYYGYYTFRDDVYGNLAKNLRVCSEMNKSINIEDGIDKEGIDVTLLKSGDGIVKGVSESIYLAKNPSLDYVINVNIEDLDGNILNSFRYKPLYVSETEEFPFHIPLEDTCDKYIISVNTNVPGSYKYYYSNDFGRLVQDKEEATIYNYLDITEDDIYIRTGNMDDVNFSVSIVQSKNDLKTFLNATIFIENEDREFVNISEAYTGSDLNEAIASIRFKEAQDEKNNRYSIYYKINEGSSSIYYITEGYFSESGATDNYDEATKYTAASLEGKKIIFELPKRDVNTEIVHVKDNVLKDIILNKVGRSDGEIYLKDIEKVEELDISDSEVKTLEGLEKFIWLETLDIRNTKISSLTPLIELGYLENLYIEGSKVEDYRDIYRYRDSFYYHVDVYFDEYKEGPHSLKYTSGSYENGYWKYYEDPLMGDKLIFEWSDYYYDGVAEGYYLYSSNTKYGEYKKIPILFKDKEAIIDRPNGECYYRIAGVVDGRETLFSEIIEYPGSRYQY